MKITEIPDNLPKTKRTPPPPKRNFKEVYKPKKDKPKEQEPIQASIFQQTAFEVQDDISLEAAIAEVAELIETHIRDEGTSTTLTVGQQSLFAGTQIVVETDPMAANQFHIELLTHPEAVALLGSNISALQEALKAALPHITCHIAQPALLSQFDKSSMLSKNKRLRNKDERIHEKNRIDRFSI
ncbi:MAG: hypothetical protein SP1CHLAM54_17430 [Chlamydiia bacterium]|nr:hypothetical protein [Chlamydiia bacterium]MCH9616631.1 hypothetical protein [Chlamydiia bacterium]MCH9629362.1 hypothetical protein [Chlamydiia bacterium]